MLDSTVFKDRKLVLATMHKKEEVMAPLLEQYLGVEVVVPKMFDTDAFGTFTKEIKRPGDQLETARAKAYAALEREGGDLAMASEGTFGSHPTVPFVMSNLELVVLVDKTNGYEVRGHCRTSKTNMYGRYVSSVDEALSVAEKIGFPEHGVIVRKKDTGTKQIYKDIKTKQDLIQITQSMLSSLFTNRIYIESDMRAHRNPTRRLVIRTATEDVIQNSQSLCPQCSAPGFVATDSVGAADCSRCGATTDMPRYDICTCSVCSYEEKRVGTYGTAVDPQYCSRCNP